MKVLCVAPSLDHRYGGATEFVIHLADALSGLTERVEVVTTFDRTQYTKIPVTAQHLKITRAKRSFLSSPYKVSADLWKVLSNKIPTVDIVHIHSLFQFSSFAAGCICRRHHIPYVVSTLGQLNQVGFNVRHRFQKTLCWNLFDQRLLSLSCGIHVCSLQEEREVKNRLPLAKTFTVPLGGYCEVDEKLRTRNILCERFPELKNSRIVIFLGRITLKKRVDLLVQALGIILKKRDNVYLVIAGFDEQHQVQQLKRLACQLNIQKNVIFTGFVSSDERISYLSSSDVFALSSSGENFAISVVEAMSCKVPVVISQHIGISDIVKSYNAGIITDMSPANIAHALEQLLDDTDACKRMGSAGQLLAAEKFRWDLCAKNMAAQYQRILNRDG